MKAKSIKGNSTGEIQIALDRAMSDGFTPTLAIIFLSIKQDREAISSLFSKYDIAIFGATTGGEFIGEEMSEGSIAIMLLNLDKNLFSVHLSELDGENDRKIARELGEIGRKKFEEPAFLISTSHLESVADLILNGLQDAVGDYVNVFGGLAGDDFTMTEQYVFTNKKESSQGVVTVILDEEKLEIKTLVAGGWQPAGTEKTITKSNGPWVYTIDDKPALDLISKFIGFKQQDFTNPLELVIEMAVNCPMQLSKENGPPVMRGVFMADWDKKAVMCAAGMPEGSKIRFSLPPDFGVIDNVIDDLNILKNSDMPDADAVLVFSCLGRKITFGPMIQQELEGINNVWDAPMIGFFSNGELGRAKGGDLEQHGSTVVCVAIKEKK